ncbi:MAG: DUF4440 domain-containing protein [Melioribacteraceae bacterium]|nr:DUF4440 domain-containing protein [Melioribacteraceae bacterium]
MKKINNSFLQIALGVMLLSNIIVGQSEDDLREIVNQNNQKFMTSIMEDNLEGYLSCYTDDAIVMLPFMAPIKGKYALTAHWHNNMSRGGLVESADVTTLDIWSSGDLIYERGSYQITFKKHEGKPRVVYGSYFSIWQKQKDGSYKMKYDISNLDHGV